ncbi:PKD domain-containing protein [Methanomicrobium mobile]|uniref:PKD domain-containing protein n=1 Tax=Methanomicrobium mobile TaxID=2205 RepID=UPI0005B2E632|nr:PKD domain-containing protein [Methanomicrobium mobile]
MDKTATLNITLTPGKTWSDFLKLEYAATVSYGTATYKWDFNGEGSPEAKSGTFTFGTTGTKTITVTATPPKGVTLKNPTETKTVTIAEPKLEPKISVDAVAGTYKINFEDKTGVPDEYVKSRLWDFDAGNTSSKATSASKSGTYEYKNSGTYTVKMKITTVGGQTKTAEQPISIKGLTADFSADPTSGGAPLEVKFTDKSSKNSVTGATIDFWKWDFGDGSSPVYEQNPTHKYTKVGKYTVTLMVSDTDSSTKTSNSDTVTKKDYIVVDEGLYPTANFDVASSSSRSGNAPLEVKFVDKSKPAASSNATITSWSWKITNSGGSTVKTASTQDLTYKFEDGGKYTVSLTVTDKNGKSNTKTETDYITVSSGLSATFTASPTSGTAPLNVRFEAKPDPDNTYDIDEYAWNFGDGTAVSYGRVISHVYQSAGTYTVKMTVTDEKSKTYTATRSNYITVTAASKTVAPTATPTVAAGSESDKTKSSKLSKGDRIFGIPGTQPIRSEMQRMYGFFDDFFTLFFGMFGK